MQVEAQALDVDDAAVVGQEHRPRREREDSVDRGVQLLGVDSANCPMELRQAIWNKLAVAWRPDCVHDQVRTIDFEELPAHFDAYIKGLVRGRTVVRIASDTHP